MTENIDWSVNTEHGKDGSDPIKKAEAKEQAKQVAKDKKDDKKGKDSA